MTYYPDLYDDVEDDFDWIDEEDYFDFGDDYDDDEEEWDD